MPDTPICAAVAAMRSASRWRPAWFFEARVGGAPVKVHGYEWRGLAMWHTGWATPRTATRWMLVHLGSGGAVARFTGDIATVMPVAGEIAECGDWTLFDLPEGWRQTDPDLPAKVAAILDAHPEARPESDWPDGRVSDDDARAVIAAREASLGERDPLAAAKREREVAEARFRAVLADSGPRGAEALRAYETAMRDVESGVHGARMCWHSMSPAQRRVCLFLATGRVLVRCRWSRNHYDAVGEPHAIARAARLDTVRALARHGLVAWDGTAADPEARAVATERMRFVAEYGQATP